MTDHHRLIRDLYSEPGERLKPATVWRALQFTWATAWRADRLRLIAVVAVQAAYSFAFGAIVIVGRGVVARVLPAGSAHAVEIGDLAWGLAGLAGIAFANTLLGIAGAALQQVLQLKVEQVATGEVVGVAAAVDLAEMENPAFHDRIQRAVATAQGHLRMFLSVAFSLVGVLFTLVAVGVAVAVMAWWLLPIVALAMAPALRVAGSRRRAEFTLMLELMENVRARAYLLQVLTGRDQAKEVRAFGLVDVLRRRLSDRYADAIDRETRFVSRYARRAIGARLAGDAVLALTVVAVLVLVRQGYLTVASAVTALGAVAIVSAQARTATAMTEHAGVTLLLVSDLAQFCALDGAWMTPPVDGGSFTELRADHVTFTYPAGERPALSDVSVTVKAGQVIALVGENGSGKTTLAKILCGLHQPSQGNLSWDGRPADPPQLRAASAVLFQDFQRYKLTAADNIGFGQPDNLHDLTAIQHAARLAGADDLIAALPAGFQTVLSSEFAGGVDLSSGQWQRIALARAFRRNAAFVILDEPTAALDARAEAQLFGAIRDVFGGKTVLLISHRFASVRTADHIYVLHHGVVVEHGTHSELIDLGGMYADMYRLQASAYLDHQPSL